MTVFYKNATNILQINDYLQLSNFHYKGLLSKYGDYDEKGFL